jgi:hypothetical protein
LYYYTLQTAAQTMFIRLSLIIILSATIGVWYISDGTSYLRRLTLEAPSSSVVVRPVMHTFFAELIGSIDAANTSAGMTANAHIGMINTWKDSWHEAGWNSNNGRRQTAPRV